MMDPVFLNFWASVPDEDLVEQRLYRRALASRIFTGRASPLARLSREGGGTLDEFSPLGRLTSLARRAARKIGRNLFPAVTCAATVGDPTVTWWRRDPGLREWAWRTLENSPAICELFELSALRGLVEHESFRDYDLAQTGIWNLLTIAGAERIAARGGRAKTP
jgi:hypothetical protein